MIKNKRIIAFFLAISTFVLMSPFAVFAEDEIKIEWSAGWDAVDNADAITHYYIKGIHGKITVSDGTDYGGRLDFSTTAYPVDYDIPVAKTGWYLLDMEVRGNVDFEILVDDLVRLKYALRNSSAPNLEKNTIGYLYLEEGNEKFSVKLTNKINRDHLRMSQCTLTYVGETAISSTSISDNAVTSRATDLVSIDFINTIDKEGLQDASTTLTAQGSGKTLPVVVSGDNANDKRIIIAFANTLDYNETYTLTYNNLPHGIGFKESGELEFSTPADADADTTSINNASVEIDSIEFADNTFTLKGAVKGSYGQGIAGRKVTATVTHPKDGLINLEPVFSVENGIYTLEYEIEGTDDDNGAYSFDISSEYCDKSAKGEGRYISEGEMLRILEALENNASADDVKKFLTDDDYENANILGVDLKPLELISGKEDGFYTRLATATYKNEKDSYDMDVFTKICNSSMAMELIEKSADASVTESVFENEDYVSALGLDLGRFELLNNEKDNFLNAVTDMPRQESAADFAKEFDRLANISLLKENDKTDITINVLDYNIYDGQTADIIIGLDEKVTDLSGYTLTVKCPNEAEADKLSLTAPEGCSAKVERDGDTVKFTVKDISDELDSLGTLCYNSDGAVSVEFEFSGEAVYTVSDVPYPLTAFIQKSDTTVTVEKKSSSRGDSGKTSYSSGGFVSGGSVSTTKPDTTPVEPSGTTAPSDAGFTDIAGVEWAQKSINDLYLRGIISASADNRFRPNDTVTRAEFVKMLVEALGISDKRAGISFLDVNSGVWYHSYVSSAVYYELVTGDEKNCFNPDANITRQDICVLLSRAMDKLGYAYQEISGEPFADDVNISDYAKNAVYRMKARSVVNGTGNGNFSPKDNATRAMAAKMINSFIEEAGL